MALYNQRTGFPRPNLQKIIPKYLDLTKEFGTPEDVGRIYAGIAELEQQSGFPDWQLTIDYARKALQYPIKASLKIRLYDQWTQAAQRKCWGLTGQALADARREIAPSGLTGLRTAVVESRKLQKEIDAIPNIDPRYARITHPELDFDKVCKDYSKRCDLEGELYHTREHADCCFSDVVFLYTRFPGRIEELRELATQIIQDPATVDQLVKRTETVYRERIAEELANKSRKKGSRSSGHSSSLTSPTLRSKLTVKGAMRQESITKEPSEAEKQTIPNELNLAKKFDVNEPGNRDDKNRDLAVKHYKRALLKIKDTPERIKIEYRIGILLSQISDDKNKQVVKDSEAFKYFERVSQQYKYEDVYRKSPIIDPSLLNFNDSPELMIPSAAILAGDYCAFEKKDAELARTYYLRSMNCLKYMYERQVADWGGYISSMKKNNYYENKPGGSIKVPGVNFSPNSDEGSRQLERISKIENMEKMIKTGNVFSDSSNQYLLVESVVRRYVASFGQMDPAMQQSVLNKITNEFQNTPISKAAQQYLNKVISNAGAKEDHKIDINQFSGRAAN